MQLPGPVRAYVGLLATAADEAKRLPDRAIEFPMLAVSTALQLSLRAQQRYAQLTARGDDVLNRRQTSDDPPPWATFDEPVDDVSAEDVAVDVSIEDVAVEDVAVEAHTPPKPNGRRPVDTAVIEELAVDEPPIEQHRKPRPRKRVNAPRHTPPSRFDAVGDTGDTGDAIDTDDSRGSAESGD